MRRHKIEISVYYEDTDMAGVVYYANYLKYFERARTELFRAVGVDPVAWLERGVTFAVTRAEAKYKGSARYGDVLVVDTIGQPGRGARLSFEYAVTRKSDGALLVTGVTDMACLNKKMRPRPLPDEIRVALGDGQ